MAWVLHIVEVGSCRCGNVTVFGSDWLGNQRTDKTKLVRLKSRAAAGGQEQLCMNILAIEQGYGCNKLLAKIQKADRSK